MIDFYYFCGVDLLTILVMSQTSLWVLWSGCRLLCLLVLRQFLATVCLLRIPAGMYLLHCCYRYSGVGCICHTSAHSVLTADVLCCYSDQGLILSFCRVLLYICHQEVPGAANYQSLLECFLCKGLLSVHYEVSFMLLEITCQWLSCVECLYCVLGSEWSWKSWLEIVMVIILQLNIWIDSIILVKNKNNVYLAQIVICTRYCAPAWIMIC